MSSPRASCLSLPPAIVTVLLVIAVDVLSFMVLMPIIDTFSQALGASKAMVGMQFTVYSVGAVVSSFVVGRVSDIYGRKVVFIACACGTFSAAVGCIFLTNFSQFLACSALSGLSTGTVGTAYAYIGDVTADETKRARYIAYATATMSLCFVVGPLVGGLVASLWTLRSPFFLTAGIALVEILFVCVYLQNPSEIEASKRQALLYSDNKQQEIDKEYAAKDAYEDETHPRTMSRATSFSELIVNGVGVPGRVSFSATPHYNNNNTATTTSSTANSNATDQKGEESERLLQQQTNITRTVSKNKITNQRIRLFSPVEDSVLRKTSINSEDTDIFGAIDEESTLREMLSPLQTERDSENAFASSFYNNNNSNNDNSNSGSVNQMDIIYAAVKKEMKERSLFQSTNTHPWCDYRALLVGGVGTALNTITYLGLIALLPLVLQESKYGIVTSEDNSSVETVYPPSESTGAVSLQESVNWIAATLSALRSDGGSDDDGLSDHDIKTISRWMGFYLGAYGCTQVLGMILLFPRVQRCLGLLYTGVLGCLFYGASFFLILITSKPTDVFYVCIPMALANSLCRPVFPTFLGAIATAERRAEYMAITATFSNLALMIGGQMTVLYSTFSAQGAIILCGTASMVNAACLLVFAVMHHGVDFNKK